MSQVADQDAAEPADAAARARALDIRQSFIVQAPAGSGKTELLIQRFLGLLGAVEAPEEVLAITFTVKAAAEMRQRVMSALSAAQTGEAVQSPHQQRTRDLAQQVLARDAEQGWHLSNNPARLGIQTIDALCMRLAASMPVMTRLGGSPRITDHAQPLYLEAARLAVLHAEPETVTPEDATRGVGALLLHLDNDVEVVCRMLAQMLGQRDRWLRHIAATDDPALARDALEAGLRSVIDQALQRAQALLPEWLSAALPGIAAEAGAVLAIQSKPNPIAACVDMQQMPEADWRALEQWQGLCALLLTDAGKLRARITSAQGLSADSAEQKLALKDLLERLTDEQDLVAALHGLRTLPHPHYTEAQWELVQALLQLLPGAVAQLKLVFDDHGMVDFTEVTHAALRALGDPQEPTDLALSLDYRLSHLLIDEFQDTSFTQVALLERLTGGWQQNDGRTLFLVGDPMQSIYRFREAEVSLFDRARRYGIGQLRPQALNLTCNFRSQAGLVEWVNSTFEPLFDSAPGSQQGASGGGMTGGAVTFAPATAVLAGDEGEPTSLFAQDGADPAVEAAHIVELITQARARDSAQTVAVLVRARHHLSALVPALRAAGLAFRALDIEPLAGQSTVQDLHALTRALVHLGDRNAWLSVLRAPWCGLVLADLLVIGRSSQSGTIWEALIDERCRRQLSDDGQKRMSRVKRVLAEAFAHRARRPLHRWVEGVWWALGGNACCRSESERLNARRYLGLLQTLDKAGWVGSLQALEQGLRQLYAAPDPHADESLQLMTIHRAKGLEFDTVIIPGLGGLPARSRQPLLSVAELPLLNTLAGDAGGGAQSRLSLAPLSTARRKDRITRYLTGLDRRCDRNEQIRLLYVAATRAKNQLHLLGHTRPSEHEDRPASPAADSLLARLWPVLSKPFLTHLSARSIQATHEPTEDTLRRPVLAGEARISRLSSQWVLPPAPAALQWTQTPMPVEEEVTFVWASDVARLVGTAVHRALQQIAYDGLVAWREMPTHALERRLRGALVSAGMRQADLQDGLTRAVSALQRSLADPRMDWLFDPAHRAAYSEWPLSGIVAGHPVSVVIDRSFVDADGVRWIVDYKTGDHQGGELEAFLDNEVARYRGQLQRYAGLLRQVETRTTRLAIYFPLLTAWRQWEADAPPVQSGE